MALQKDSSRITTGQQLTNYYNQAKSNIEQLKNLKTQLLNIKTIVSGDATTYAADDLADVNAILTTLANDLKTI